MKVTIHRGTNQIGGCVTEYEYNGWRLFVDYGEQLPGSPELNRSLEIEGLTQGDVRKSALLITHYHGDHIGKIAEISPNIPICMGKISKEIASELANHLSGVSSDNRELAERLESVKTFTAGKQFSFGEFRIMPIVMDHSAFDSYAFCIGAGNLKIFHTGDFRTHGFRSGKLSMVIDRFVGKVDYMVCEATNVNRPNAISLSEYELQRKFTDSFRENKFNVVYVSSTNIDRLFSIYQAALRAGREFLIDGYQKKMMDIISGHDTVWGKSKFYQYVKGREPKPLKYQKDSEFLVTDSFKTLLDKRGYVIIARSTPRFDNLLSRLPATNRKVYLSQWNGYLNPENKAFNFALAKSVGPKYEYFHTSGHCNMQSLETLINQLCPKAIIPIHTDNPQAFANLFCDKWTVILLKDGESLLIN